MDLPSEIQALKTIYEQYWNNKSNLKEPPTFDEYYQVYLKDTDGKRQKFVCLWTAARKGALIFRQIRK